MSSIDYLVGYDANTRRNVPVTTTTAADVENGRGLVACDRLFLLYHTTNPSSGTAGQDGEIRIVNNSDAAIGGVWIYNGTAWVHVNASG